MKSVLLFLAICIPTRILFALSSQYIPMEYLKYFGLLLLTISLSFFYLFLTNSRLNAPEAGGKTWWASFRPIIGSLYLASALYCFTGKRKLILIPMAIDIIFGIILFLLHHKNSF